MDIFEEKNISPMLIAENQVAFNSPDYIYELKLDGIRCLAYLDNNSIELRNKRNKKLNDIYPELSDVFPQAKKRCILDGELVILKEGKPDFYELQRRSLMSNPFKIDLSAQKLPVCLIAFDILYLENEQVTNLTLLERKALLLGNITESPKLAISRHIEQNGLELYQAAEKQGLEGIVAKKKDSKYYFGKLTKDWIKMKALLDDDFVVCGYYLKEGSVASIILGAYDNDNLKYQSHVILGLSKQDFKIISSTNRVTKIFYNGFPIYEGAIWIEPKNVCTVSFMERLQNGGLRQPVFKGLRDDKLPNECVVPNR